MASKRQTLNLLKRKVNLMQKDLKVYEKRGSKITALPDFLKPVHKITHTKRKSNFSQTQRQITFQFREAQNFFNKQPSKGQSARSQDKINTQRNLSPILKDITNRIDTQYYHKKPVPQGKRSESEDSKKMCQTCFIGRRYAYNDFGLNSTEVFKAGKLRTYQQKRTDTVLNPQKEKETGIKIVRKMERSPDQMLQENPNSNTKLYIFDDKPVYMWKKQSTNQKNKSHLVHSRSKGQIMPTESKSLEKKKKSQRKHFPKYITDIYSQGV